MLPNTKVQRYFYVRRQKQTKRPPLAPILGGTEGGNALLSQYFYLPLVDNLIMEGGARNLCPQTFCLTFFKNKLSDTFISYPLILLCSKDTIVCQITDRFPRRNTAHHGLEGFAADHVWVVNNPQQETSGSADSDNDVCQRR